MSIVTNGGSAVASQAAQALLSLFASSRGSDQDKVSSSLVGPLFETRAPYRTEGFFDLVYSRTNRTTF